MTGGDQMDLYSVGLGDGLQCCFDSEIQHHNLGVPAADPGGPAPLPQDFFLNMQFSGNFKGKTPILSKLWAQAPPPLGSKLRWDP